MMRMSILAVDDEPGMLSGVERILNNTAVPVTDFDDTVELAVQTADTGNKALKLLDSGLFDILLLDHKLPDMLGLDLLSELNRDQPKLTTVMITAYASLDVAISATRNGAFDFLAKPFTPEELKHTVQKAVRNIYLKRKAERLETERKSVRFQFLSVLAHELKSPLAAVSNYLYLIRDRFSGTELKAYDGMIDRSILRLDGMRQMIFDLLDLTRIESGQMRRDWTDLEIVPLAKDIMENNRAEADRRKISLELVAGPSGTIRADRGEISIILGNLVSNAVKYNIDNGKVVLSIRQESDRIVIRCEDSGIGLSSEEQTRLFKEFSRIKNNRTKGILGSGLGLSIVHKIVRLNGGRIEIESDSGKGSVFTVFLPLQEKTEENDQPSEKRQQERRHAPQTAG